MALFSRFPGPPKRALAKRNSEGQFFGFLSGPALFTVFLIPAVFWLADKLIPDEALAGSVKVVWGFLIGNLLTLFLLLVLGFAVRQIMRLRKRIDLITFNRGRWNDPAGFGKIQYGHVSYAPLLAENNGHGPSGVGVDLLKKLLDFEIEGKPIEVVPHRRNETWSSMVEGLIDKRFDIVATPVFATAERSRKIAFSMPIFFSSIGVFMNKKVAEEQNLHDLGIAKLDTRLDMIKDLEIIGIDQEISGKLGDKLSMRLFGHPIKNKEPSNTMPESLFEAIDRNDSAPVVFYAETAHALYSPTLAKNSVVNILARHKILYPVCFAIRLGDYQLANLLNIRLLELAENGGAFKLLVDEIRKRRPEISIAEIEEHFVAQWPVRSGDAKVA